MIQKQKQKLKLTQLHEKLTNDYYLNFNITMNFLENEKLIEKYEYG